MIMIIKQIKMKIQQRNFQNNKKNNKKLYKRQTNNFSKKLKNECNQSKF